MKPKIGDFLAGPSEFEEITDVITNAGGDLVRTEKNIEVSVESMSPICSVNLIEDIKTPRVVWQSPEIPMLIKESFRERAKIFLKGIAK